MSTNPYQSPAALPVALPAPRHSRFDIHELLWWCINVTLRGVVVIGFVCFVAWCVQIYYAGAVWNAAGMGLLMGMLVFAFAGDNWVERAAASLSVPFTVAGAGLGVCMYFYMFNFRWFSGIFNGSAAGPLGLIFTLFVCGVLTASVTYNGIHYALLQLARRLN